MYGATPWQAALQQRRILLGVTGGIAAYKAAELVRLLKQSGAEVRVVMTAAAREFVTALTFQALSGEPVHTELLDPQAEAGMGHIELARWAEAILIAPASAHCLAQLAQGLAGDLLTTVCLASQAPLFCAPAMNQAMWHHPATQQNVASLIQRGNHLLGPGQGEQACGDVGLGRMLEPQEIMTKLGEHFSQGKLLGKRVLITAGPTQEPLDPVRYLTNRSSGKMGYALAAAARAEGAEVVLISGPVVLDSPAGVRRVSVMTAEEMLAAVQHYQSDVDIIIACAAVADYRPENISAQKIKKSDRSMMLPLTKNPDILQIISQQSPRPFLVGFAAETESLIENAQKKLISKQLDMIAVNRVGLPEQGFESDDNALTVLWADEQVELPLQHKTHLANALLALIHEVLTGS